MQPSGATSIFGSMRLVLFLRSNSQTAKLLALYLLDISAWERDGRSQGFLRRDACNSIAGRECLVACVADRHFRHGYGLPVANRHGYAHALGHIRQPMWHDSPVVRHRIGSTCRHVYGFRHMIWPFSFPPPSPDGNGGHFPICLKSQRRSEYVIINIVMNDPRQR